MSAPAEVTCVRWVEEAETLRDIRKQVFIDEQRVPRELEWDGADEGATHFLARAADGTPVGTARLLPSGQIGRMAVLARDRHKGIGRALLDAAVSHASEAGMGEVFLHAQQHAAAFYRAAGFEAHGREFMEAGIAHVSMRRPLFIEFRGDPTRRRTGGIHNPEPRAGSARGDVPEGRHTRFFRHRMDCLAALTAILGSARRGLEICSPLLDHTLFESPEVVGAVSDFARDNPSNQVRILIHDSKPIVSRGHELIALAQRLSSKIEIRRVSEFDLGDEESYVLADRRGVWLLPDAREHIGHAHPDDRVAADRLSRAFDERWERSPSDPELRTLSL